MVNFGKTGDVMKTQRHEPNHALDRAPPNAAPAFPDPVSEFRRARRMGRVLAVLEPLSVAALFIFMLEKSWLRWPDPLIDFPKNLYIAWRVSVGDRLYDEIHNWYGPLSNLIEGAGFRVFGVGLDTMVWMNVALTVAVLLLLRGIFGTIGSRLMKWLASVVFLGVFAFGHYLPVGNYNFITPYASQATYSFAGLSLCLWGLLRHLHSNRRRWLVVAGLGVAVAYLDKPECLLAAGGAMTVYVLMGAIHQARMNPVKSDWRGAGAWAQRSAAWLAAGFGSLWLPVFVYFWARGGLAYAFLATDYVPYTVFSGTYRRATLDAPVVQGFFGFDHPWENFAGQVMAGGWLVVVSAVLVLATRNWMRVRPYRAAWWSLLLVVLATGLIGGWLAWRADFVVGIGHALVFPVLLATLAVGVSSLRSAWSNRPEFARLLGLAVVGVAASLMLVRMILNGRISHYGFYMMPLAALFWGQLIMVEAAHWTARGRPSNGLLPVVFSGLIVLGTGWLVRGNLSVYATKNYAVGEGRDRFYTFSADSFSGGHLVNLMVQMVKEQAAHARTLTVFPEGIAVNYHLRVPTALAELEFNPSALSYVGPAQVLQELRDHVPEAVLLYSRDLTEYGFQEFGDHPASGGDLVQWLKENYFVAEMVEPGTGADLDHDVKLLVPRPGVGPVAPANK